VRQTLLLDDAALEPLLFFRFLSSLCIQLDEIVGDTALASRHWLDLAAQERVMRGWTRDG
jgi:hypothetical protein